MKEITLKGTGVKVPAIAIGCMRISGMEHKELVNLIEYCVGEGLHFFDHADIYGGGACESVFAKAFKETNLKREEIMLQSKCGIKPGVMFDFSKEYILEAVDGILKRLDTEYLDMLVLHRPDALVEPEEVAEAFDKLESSGKVRGFGVSNHKPMQIELLKKYVKQPIAVNQMQLSIPFSNMIASGLEVNMLTEGAIDRDGSVLDYCRLHDITLQAWSPFQYGFFEGVFVGNKEKFPELNKVLEELSEKYQTTPTGIATAWILRHPARVQMISGSTSKQRISEMVEGSKITLSREEWYKLYLSAGHILP